ncbi:thrombospondin type-1 domain-containing protein 7A isoform X2 [Corythoichthys intestinalis]|uniref:thrombospondin type-1 domain-containing protein 7A isoform X2 n=1 Tax=Corythoichthys intestinalis TaxID=161448 RepID=UPI0025A6074E|nr:thrombospondin type-1 domain-containing protein 7A isoform X2 [Corythoichthys intestinalis]
MGLASRAVGKLGVLKWIPPLWRLALFFFSIRQLDAQAAKPRYIWQTGPWGRCMGSECGPGGSQSRAVWCAHSEGWTTLHTNCDQSERPNNQQICFRVCDWHKDLYDWQLGAWNQCVPVSMRSAGVPRPTVCTRGEEGIQTREVGCVQKANGEPAEDAICEYFEPKPRLEQACLIPCPRDCVLSEFSPWTPCSKTCGMGLQNRIRVVLAAPLFNGAACLNLTEFQTCQPGSCEGEESQYSLRVGSWGPCSVPVARQARHTDEPTRESDEPSGESEKLAKRQGKKQSKRRDKQSRDKGDELARDGDKPLKSNRKLGKVNRKPDRPSRQADRPPRQRKVKNKEKREKIKVRERGKVKDPETRELIKKKRNRNRQNRPGGKFWDLQIGYQTREVTCVHRSGSVEALSLCSRESLPVTYQACVITKDCDVTDWSEWSACSKECYDPNGPNGERTRTRKVSQFPTGGGAECPELEESQPCSPRGETAPPCVVYNWKSTEWTECRVDLLLSQQDRRKGNLTGLCGGGIQTREVYCVLASADMPSNITSTKSKEALRPVNNDLCVGTPPNTTQLCHINCPVECDVSAWSAWGPCAFENCQDQTAKKGFKMRKRKIVNDPTGGTGNCPHLVEAIPCEDPRCYDWLVVKLEACISDHEMECGPGTRNPQVQCVNSDGQHVERQLCRDAILPMPVICEVPCPKDCAISPWTEWSHCSHTCSGKNTEGKQTRARSILAYNAEQGGMQCPNVSALLEVRSCNDHPCTVYHWQTGSWGQCIEDSSIPATNTSLSNAHGDDASCSVGMQTRKVICVRVNVGQVPPKKCPESLRPDTVRPCLLPCKRDCSVTPYSDWNSNSPTCQKGGKTKKKQSRKRLIIQLPANGGQECPEVLTQEREIDTPAVCPGYRWKTHKWRRCQMVPWSIRQDSPGAQETCGSGLQVRAVSCRKLDGGQADVEACLKFSGSMPALTQLCQLPCQEDCQLSSWSKFSPCTADCVGVRVRKRILVGKSKKREQCKNHQLYPLSETKYCPCNKYNAQPVGNWSDCILSEGGRAEGQLGMKVLGDIKECGQGYRYQAVVCYDQDNRIVQTSHCNSHGYIEEACIIPCPSDCKLSEWSNWSRCSKSCGSGVKVRSKWLREKPYNGGRPCPKLDHVNQVICFKSVLPKASVIYKYICFYDTGKMITVFLLLSLIIAFQPQAQVYEVVPCVSDCGQYVWVVEPWSIWKVTNADLKDNCGEGVQTRKVRCMLNTLDGPSEQVEDYLCDPEEMPLGARDSRLPCPEDCVLSDWGAWSPCPLPCNGNSTRERRASIARQPGEGKVCPSTTQAELCKLNSNCFHHSYNITDWSTCQLSDRAVCGKGIKTRMLDCVRSDGKSVDLKFCKELGLERKWQMNASCVVECPVNCQLSEWSAWSDCTHKCGLQGKLWRSRTVVQAPRGDGRPCPTQMQQWKPCLVKPCYNWRYSLWSECKSEGARCGEGLRFRNISCFVSDGSDLPGGLVDDEMCGEQEPAVDGDPKIILQDSCTVPCPGECYLTDWTVWSPCQLICFGGEDLGYGSVQVRSRAVVAQDPENLLQCPEQELEARPCTGGRCFEYTWQAGPWRSSSRHVWCQRSDGLNVTGGCPTTSKPIADRSCDPPCIKPRSFCTESGVCGCEEGYTEVMTSDGLLDQCTVIPVLELPTAGDSKADVKTIRAFNPTQPAFGPNGRAGRTWFLQPFGPDGKLKTWVYGVAAGVIVLLVFMMSMTYLACKKPKKPQRRTMNNRLKPLTLAYDGDADM